jgi:hypothetical protein
MVGAPVDNDQIDTDGREDWRDDDEQQWQDDDYDSDRMLGGDPEDEDPGEDPEYEK